MVNTVGVNAPTSLTQAPTNYGLDFRITPGVGVYQVQVVPEADHHRANESFERARVFILIHHYVSSHSNENAFVNNLMWRAADELLTAENWTGTVPGVGTVVATVEPGTEPTISDGTREGNVITFEIALSIVIGMK